MRFSFWKTLAAGLAIPLFIAAVVTFYSAEHPFDDRPFSKRQWTQGTPAERALMADDLRTLALGLSPSQVIELLGDPDEALNSNQYSPKAGVRGGAVFSYYIGEWPSAGFDHAFVCLFFGIDGKVVEVSVLGT